jgi:hypothetical protein
MLYRSIAEENRWERLSCVINSWLTLRIGKVLILAPLHFTSFTRSALSFAILENPWSHQVLLLKIDCVGDLKTFLCAALPLLIQCPLTWTSYRLPSFSKAVIPYTGTHFHFEGAPIPLSSLTYSQEQNKQGADLRLTISSTLTLMFSVLHIATFLAPLIWDLNTLYFSQQPRYSFSDSGC